MEQGSERWAEMEVRMHEIAREEIASLAGLVLRRTQESEATLTRSPDRNLADAVSRDVLADIFGEVLADFSGHTKEGAA